MSNSDIYHYNSSSVYYHHSFDVVANPDNYKRQAHVLYELYHLLSGNVSFVVEGKEYELNKNDIIIVRPGEIHKIDIDLDSPYERQVFHFVEQPILAIDPKKRFLRPFLDRQLGTRNLYTSSMINSDYIVQCLKNVEQAKDEYDRHIMMVSSLYAILAEIYQAFCLNQNELIFEESDRTQKIINYINRHLTEDLSLDHIANRFYISKSQLRRIFKEKTGTTIWDYITFKRLVLVRQKIQDGQAIVKASQSSGFRDYSAFYRAYVKKYGVSPSCYKDHQSNYRE